MTARVGISRSLSEAYLSLQHVGVDLDNENVVTVTRVKEATCRNAMLMAQAHQSAQQQQPPDTIKTATVASLMSSSSIYLEPVAVVTGCIVCFLIRAPSTGARKSKQWWRRRRKRPTEMYAYAAFVPP